MIATMKFVPHVATISIKQWHIDYWVRSVVGGVYHKIQIVSCTSAKIILNNGIST